MPPRVHPQQALAVYAEPLAAGRRVLVFADPETGLLERIEELGAAAVVLRTPDDDLDELRGAHFDLAMVADLTLFADPAALLACVRRLVGDSGAALVAVAKPEAAEASDGDRLDYYALFDLVAHEFADVRMIAQLAFHGVALAEVGEVDGSPSVSVDTQLADADRAPQAFVALASQRGTRLDPYAIIELPPPDPAAQDTSALDESAAEVEQARALLDRARGELQATRAQLDERTEALLTLRAHAARSVELERDLIGLKRELADLKHELAERERELTGRARQVADLSSEAERARSAAAEAGRIAAVQAEELARRPNHSGHARVEAELAHMLEAQAAELVAFEGTLRERAQAIRTLEAEVARRERMVRDLVGALEEYEAIRAGGAAPRPAARPAVAADASSVAEAALTTENAQLRRRLDGLALELARREGESHATSWTIAELERRLAQTAPSGPAAASSPADTATDPEPRLAAALDELDALRRALAQEHEARARAESGEELVRAREELARQATLLEQLGEELARAGGRTPRNEELR